MQNNYQNSYNQNNGDNQNQQKQQVKVREEREKIDHYTAQMLIYRAEMYILVKYPYLIDLNTKYIISKNQK